MEYLVDDAWSLVLSISLQTGDTASATALGLTCAQLQRVFISFLKTLLVTQYFYTTNQIPNDEDVIGAFLAVFSAKSRHFDLGSPNSVLVWRFNWWNYTDGIPENGFFLRKTVKVLDVNFCVGDQFDGPPGVYAVMNQEQPEEKFSENVEREVCISCWKHNTAKWWVEQVREGYNNGWRPEICDNLSKAFSSGRFVPINSDLKEFLNLIVPESHYVISHWKDVPVLGNFKIRRKYHQELLEGGISIVDYGDECDAPQVNRGLRNNSWVFLDLRLVSVPINSTWDSDRVQYYKNRMIQEKTYIPTCLILVPWQTRFFVPAGIVLDGHHKISAAVEIGHPIRILLVEMRHKTDKDLISLPFVADKEGAIKEYLKQCPWLSATRTIENL